MSEARTSYLRGLIGCVSLALLGACGDQQLQACDVVSERCQQDVYYAVTRLRGDGLDPFDGVPPIRTLTLEEYRAELEANAADDLAVEQPDEGDEDEDADEDEQPPAPRLKPWDRALQLLGMLTREVAPAQAAIDDSVSNVAAFYSSGIRRVTVIDDGEPQNTIGDTATLAHELVHAFQDRDGSLALYSNATDDAFVERAMIEGEATVYELLAVAEMQRLEPHQIEWSQVFDRALQGRRNSMVGAKSPFLTASRWFVYPLGGRFLAERFRRGGNAALLHVLGDPPRASRTLMDESGDAASTRPIDCAFRAPDGFERVGFDRFGALQLYALLAKHTGEEGVAWQSSLGWRDDLIWLYYDEEADEIAVFWLLRLVDRAAAREMSELLSEADFSAIAERSDLWISAGDNAELTASWTPDDACE